MFMGKIDLYLFFLGHVSEFGIRPMQTSKKLTWVVFLLVVICGRL